MIEVSPRFGMHFLLLRKINNKPGTAALIMESLKKAGIDIEYFQAIAYLKSRYADVFMLAVSSNQAETAIETIKEVNGKVGEKSLMIIENLAGIVIKGITLKDSTDVLHRAFKVCGKLGINVAMAYTTLVTLNIYISARHYTDKLVNALQKEFEKDKYL